jgi:hypothetical protein
VDRPLGVVERALTRTDAFAPLTMVALARLDAAPSPEALRAALDRLQRRHPLLRARIVDGRRFADGAPPIPLERAARSGEERWTELVDRELNRRIDAATGPLLRCSYLRDEGPDPGPAELCLSLHHALADGVAVMTLLDTLLRDLAGVAGDRLVSDPAPAADALIPTGVGGRSRRLRYVARELGADLGGALGGRRRRPTRTSLCRAFSGDLDAERTAALARTGRRHRVGLPATVHAAMLLALRQRGAVGSHATGIAFSDLRPYLAPPRPTGTLGCYIAMLRFRTPLPEAGSSGADGGGALWPLAQRIQSEALQAGRRGDRFPATLSTDLFMRLALATRAQRLGDAALSFAGTIALDERYGAVRVRALHGYISNNALGARFTAQGRLFAGRLMLDAVQLDDDDTGAEAEALLDTTFDLLAEGAGAPP